MSIYVGKNFVLKGIKGQEVILSNPYLNDDKELEFRYCSIFSGEVLLNRTKQSLDLKLGKKTVCISLKGKNKAFYEEAIELRQKIVTDIVSFSNAFANGKESICVFETGNEQYPYYISTPIIINNGGLSSKYIKGFLHFFNEEAKFHKKDIRLKDEGELQSKVGNKLKNYNLKSCNKGSIDNTSYYEMSLKSLVKLF